jgi:type I restriction-modification system DNA methylase subunit
MNHDPLDSLAQLEAELWQAADNLRANSGLASSEYRMPVLGVIFPRHAAPLARMNLAVHGLEGDIRDANTYYEDAHTLAGKCDFVMANPPFNVDEVDAERVKDDKRLPFGLPGVNKQKKVSNGNYLGISYFYSYLNPRGRAGFVMSSQASSAGHGEKEVRRKIVESGAVDVNDLDSLELLLHADGAVRAMVFRPRQAGGAAR